MTTHGAVLDADALDAVLWLLVAQAGHHGCDGWTFEGRGGLVECACGAALYEVRQVDGASGASLGAASRPGPGRAA